MSLSLEETAQRVQGVAIVEGEFCAFTRQTMHEIEHGRIPHPRNLRWLAAGLGLPIEQITEAARQQRTKRRELLVEGKLQASWNRAALEDDVNRRTLVARVPAGLAGMVLTDHANGVSSSATDLDRDLLAAAERAKKAGDGLGNVGASIALRLDRVTARWRRLDDTHGAIATGEGIAEHIETIAALLPSAADENARVSLLSARASAEQLAVWCAWEQQKLAEVLRWSNQAIRDATQGGNRPLAGYALSRAAMYQLRSGRITDAAASMAPVWRVARLPETPLLVASCFAAQCANVLAANGDRDQAVAACDWSREAFSLHAEQQADAPGWVYFFTEQQMTEWLGRAAILLGRWDEAARELEATISTFPAQFPREAGVALTALAEVRVGQGDLEAADELGDQALEVAERFDSVRGVKRVEGVYRRMLGAAPNAHATQQLGERLSAARRRVVA